MVCATLLFPEYKVIVALALLAVISCGLIMCHVSMRTQGFCERDQSKQPYCYCPYLQAVMYLYVHGSEYSIHRTTLQEGDSGFVKCLVKRSGQLILNIERFGTEELRILYSPGYFVTLDQ